LRRGFVLLVVYLVFAVVLGFVVRGFAGGVWGSWVGYEPPRFSYELSPFDVNAPPLARRVVVVLVDGARPDLVERYATPDGFGRVFASGVWFGNAWAFTPTYSVPARAALSTGLPHELSGVSSNWYSGGELEFPSIFSLAKERGLKTAAVGDSSIYTLFKSAIDVYVEVEETREHSRVAVEEAIKLLRSGSPPDLLWVGMASVDEAGHDYGAASVEYREALEEASRLFAELLKALEEEGLLEETLVVLVSDHGHLDRGGHGGPEEEVARFTLALMGPHVVKGARVDNRVTMASVAATIAMALGLPARITAYGPPLVWAFTNETMETLASYTLALAWNLYHHLEGLRKALGVDAGGLEEARGALVRAQNLLGAGDLKGSLDESLRAYDLMLRYYDGLRSRAYHSEPVWIALVAVALVASAGLIAASSRAVGFKAAVAAIACGAAGVAVFWAYFTAVEGYALTMSSVNDLGDYINAIMRSSIAALIATGLLVAATLRLGKLATAARLPYALIAAHVALVAIASTPIYATLLTYGAHVKFPFPDWSLAYLYYTSLIGDVFLLLLAPLQPATAALTWIALRAIERIH